MKSISKTLGYLVIGLTALATSAYADRLYVPAVRELPELRSATSRHFLLADGTFSAECSLEPMNYRATDGTWQPIDTNLNPTTKNAFALANESNTLKTYLPNTGGGWVRVEAGQGAVSFRPLGVADGTSSVKGNRLDFADVGRNMTLSYEALPGRLKETLTISAPIGAPSFSYALRPEGLAAREKSDGSVALVDDAGSVVLTVESPWMQDADGHRSTDLVVALTPQGADYVYTLTPDPAWLANARYPVVIDPSLTATFANPGAYAGYDYPTYTYLATPNAYVGATSAFQVGAFRPFLQFDASSLPLDAEVDSALLQYTVTSALNLNTITIEAREFPFLVEPTDIVWSQDSGRNDLMIGQDLSSFAAGIPKTYTFNGGSSFPFYDYYGLDVTSIVSSWADKRYIKDGNDQFQPLMLNLVLHDTADGPNGYGSGNHLGIFCSTSGSGPLRLTILYQLPGWYTLQGNMRHTGRAQTSVPSDATLAWSLTNGNPANYTPPAYTTGYLPDVGPGVLAIPNPNSAGDPILFVATSNGQSSTTVYRIPVVSGVVQQTQIVSRTLSSFVVSGTPLFYQNKLWVTGNTTPNRMDPNGQPPNASRTLGVGSMRILNGTDLADATGYASNPIVFNSTIYSSPVPNPARTGVLVSANEYTDDEWYGYLYSISAVNGAFQWNVTPPPAFDSNGFSIPAETPPPATYSSACVGHATAFIGSSYAYLMARNLSDGQNPWYGPTCRVAWDSSIEGSPNLFDGKIFTTGLDDDHVGTTSYGFLYNFTAFPSGVQPTPFYFWHTPVSLFTNPFHYMWTTPAVAAEDRVVVVADDTGTVFAYDIELGSNTSDPTQRWYRTTLGNPIRSSPIVSGAPGATPNVFIAADGGANGYVYAFNAEDGTGALAPLGNQTLNGKIRSSMAVYNGRLYVLTTAGGLYCFQ